MMMSQRNGVRLLCGVVVSMALSLGACGVPSETYTQALRDLDHSRDRLAQAERSISTQRTALDNLRQANQKLNVRLVELEELTASQNVEAVSLDRQLQRVTAEREELLLEIAEIEGQLAAIQLGSDADDGSAIDPCPATEPGLSAEDFSAEDFMAAAGVGEKNVMMSTRHLSDRTIKLLPESYMFDEGSFTLSDRAIGALCWIFTDVETAAIRQLHVGVVVSSPSTGSQDQQFGTPWNLAAKRAVAIVRQLEAQGLSPDVSLVNRSSLKIEESDQIDSTQTVSVQLGHITIEVVWSDKKPEFDAPHPLLGPSKSAPSRQEPADPEAEQPADAESDAVDSPQTEGEPQS